MAIAGPVEALLGVTLLGALLVFLVPDEMAGEVATADLVFTATSGGAALTRASLLQQLLGRLERDRFDVCRLRDTDLGVDHRDGRICNSIRGSGRDRLQGCRRRVHIHHQPVDVFRRRESPARIGGVRELPTVEVDAFERVDG